jgi:acetyl-CoA/propionyl-CoA carboxylase, biotin carboxylase, biotin carboxyl carrier protein
MSDATDTRHFETVLIANRGEIAVRVIRTLRRMGIRSVAVYSDADERARHVAESSVAVRIGPRSATESYLAAERIVQAALSSGAQAIHPGYGFLAENATFARACVAAGVEFIGPPAAAIDAMGDKIQAKSTVAATGVPVVPGRGEPGMSDGDLKRAALEIGFPVLIKPSAGGGGKGMRTALDESDFDTQVAAARREARAAFGDDTLLLERFVQRPRHVEVQVLADQHGNVVHLGERECSLQRRHQKIIEESPSPLLDENTRRRIGLAAVQVARTVGYVGAGTVEFMVSEHRPDEFFFIEMNTRLQVEHPVTELITCVAGRRGIDLVEWQVRVAGGEPLPFAQDDLRAEGHAVEARVYAEDPVRRFLPGTGTLCVVREPAGPGIRVDSGVRQGDRVGPDYDPMLAKVIAWAPQRAEALRRLDSALSGTAVLGVANNVAFLRALLGHPDVRAGRLDTGLVERDLDDLVRDSAETPVEVYVAAAMERLLAMEPTGPVTDPWDIPGGWRLGEPGWSVWRFAALPADVEVRVRGRAAAAEVVVAPGQEPVAARVTVEDAELVVTYGDQTRRYRYAHTDGTTWLAAEGRTWALTEHRLLAERRGGAVDSGGVLTSPMPGTVLVADAMEGQWVHAGQALFVVEAMKMEHTVVAPVDGTVREIRVHKGQTVELGQPLAVVGPDGEPG